MWNQDRMFGARKHRRRLLGQLCVPWLLRFLCWARDEISRAAKTTSRHFQRCRPSFPSSRELFNTFAHLKVLSCCCYTYPPRSSVRGRQQPLRSSQEKQRRSPLPWKRVCGERENAGNLPKQSPSLVATLSKDRTWKKWEEGEMRGKVEIEPTVPVIKALSCLGLSGSHAHSSQLYFSLMSQVSVSGSCKLVALSHPYYWLLLQTFPAHLLPSAPLCCLYSVTLSILSTDAPCFNHDGIFYVWLEIVTHFLHLFSGWNAFSWAVFGFSCKNQSYSAWAAWEPLSFWFHKQEEFVMNLSPEVLITGTVRIRTHRHGKLHLPLPAWFSIKAVSSKLETKKWESERFLKGWWQQGPTCCWSVASGVKSELEPFSSR